MIFWDTSAVVPLLVQERASDEVRRVATEDPVLVVWWSCPVECRSAVARCERDGTLSQHDADAARTVLERLEQAWVEVLPTEEVRGHAGRLLLRHPLRAADALQLAAALTWARSRPDGHGFLCLDDRLAQAARAEGFRLAGR